MNLTTQTEHGNEHTMNDTCSKVYGNVVTEVETKPGKVQCQRNIQMPKKKQSGLLAIVINFLDFNH